MTRILNFGLLLPLSALFFVLSGCVSDEPVAADGPPRNAQSAVQSDLSLAVKSEVVPGNKVSGFVGSSHPPVIVRVMTESGKDLPTVGFGTADERNITFSTTVPMSYEFDVVVVTAYDGAGAKVTKQVRVARE